MTEGKTISNQEPPTDAQKVTLRILGLDLDCISISEMMQRFDTWIASKPTQGYAVSLINVHCAVSGLLDRQIRDVYHRADMLAIDSTPFVWLARTFRNKESSRLYPAEMILEVGPQAHKRGYKFFFYGGMPDAPGKISEFLKSKFPDIDIVGLYSPPFRTLTAEEDEEVCRMIRDSGANIMFVGLGSPKQDVWIDAHKSRLPGVIMIASGAMFDFFAGHVKQAPLWIRRAGFEWLYRLFQDPKRLWQRYTVYNVIFIGAFILEKLGLLRLGRPKKK